MSRSPVIDAPYVIGGQVDGDQMHNEAVMRLEGVLQGAVVDSTLTSPPGSPSDGDAYVVGAAASGAWSGHDDEIALWYAQWLFVTPREGQVLYDRTKACDVWYDGSGWVVGRPIQQSTGTNKRHFTVTLSGGTSGAVSNTQITASTVCALLSRQAGGSGLGHLSYALNTGAGQITVTSSSVTEASTVDVVLIDSAV